MEWTLESKAKRYEMWVQRVAIKISGWHREIERPWQIMKTAAAAAYDQYLYLGPMQRSMVRPDVLRLPGSLHCVELRRRSLLLEAVPASVRQAALNTTETTVAELLFSAMVETGPGTAKDREAVHKAVSQKGSCAIKEVYDSDQSWKFDLTRLMRLGMAPPDPTLQADTLRRMVQKMAGSDSAFQYRLHALQMNKGLFCMITQAQVDEFWRYLSSEPPRIPVSSGGCAAATTLR